jgi:hypothetical protein
MNGDKCESKRCRATAQVVYEGTSYCMDHFGEELDRRQAAVTVALYDGNLEATR